MNFRIVNYKKPYAFSLIELMISLVTISCITAAFAPVITKKIKITNPIVASTMVKSQCEKYSQDCSLCYSNKCLICAKECLETE